MADKLDLKKRESDAKKWLKATNMSRRRASKWYPKKKPVKRVARKNKTPETILTCMALANIF
jgi:hypothetical protein